MIIVHLDITQLCGIHFCSALIAFTKWAEKKLIFQTNRKRKTSRELLLYNFLKLTCIYCEFLAFFTKQFNNTACSNFSMNS